MDPASAFALVTACVSLVDSCAKIILALHNLADTCKIAELSILSLVEECTTIQFAWKKIHIWMDRNHDHLDRHKDVLGRLGRSVYVGRLAMLALEADVKKALVGYGSFRQRTNFAFIKSLVQEHQSRIRGQIGALQLLLQVMNMPSYEDPTKILHIHELAFREIAESVKSIVPSALSSSDSSTTGTNDTRTVHDTDHIQHIPHSFDDALFTSRAYNRNYRPIFQIPSYGSNSHQSRRQSSVASSDEVQYLHLPRLNEIVSLRVDPTAPSIDKKTQKALASKHINDRLAAAGYF